MKRKTDIFQKYLWTKLFPIPSSPSPSPNAHMPRFYWKSDRQRIWRKHSHAWKKSHAGYCKVKECDHQIPAPLVCHPLISLSAPSSGSLHCPLQLKTPSQLKAELHFCKTLQFGKLAFSDSSEHPRSFSFDTLSGAGRMLEVEGCREPNQGTFW